MLEHVTQDGPVRVDDVCLGYLVEKLVVRCGEERGVGWLRYAYAV